MLVSKCSSVIKAPVVPKTLSYKEMIEKEGVYTEQSQPDNIRFIVLRCVSATCVLWYNQGQLVAASPSWDQPRYKYVRVEGAEVCFEIREPKE